MKTKTVPVSPDIHKILKLASLNYGVTIQEATATIIMAGADALSLQKPDSQPLNNDLFWQLAAQAAEDMHKHGTDNIDAINATIKEYRSKRDKKKKK